VISYSSRQLRRHEEHYPTHDLELVAVVMALRMWRHYLLGNVVHIYTDHKSLTGEESSTQVLPNLSVFDITLTPTLRDEIIADQKNDVGMDHIKRGMKEGDLNVTCFREDAEGTLWFKERLLVPMKEALKKKILDEAHTSRYSIHPRSTKMYHDLRQQFWWIRMKHEEARYIFECDTYWKFKADYMKLGVLLQPRSIPEWKWDDISMYFIMGLPMTARKFDLIWVIMD
jgi:hypothetical protein